MAVHSLEGKRFRKNWTLKTCHVPVPWSKMATYFHKKNASNSKFSFILNYLHTIIPIFFTSNLVPNISLVIPPLFIALSPQKKATNQLSSRVLQSRRSAHLHGLGITYLEQEKNLGGKLDSEGCHKDSTHHEWWIPLKMVSPKKRVLCKWDRTFVVAILKTLKWELELWCSKKKWPLSDLVGEDDCNYTYQTAASRKLCSGTWFKVSRQQLVEVKEVGMDLPFLLTPAFFYWRSGC